MLNGFTGWHALVLLVIVVLIFGAAKLPGLAKSVGQSMKIFKNEVKTPDEGSKSADSQDPQLNQTSPEVKAQTDSSTSKS